MLDMHMLNASRPSWYKCFHLHISLPSGWFIIS